MRRSVNLLACLLLCYKAVVFASGSAQAAAAAKASAAARASADRSADRSVDKEDWPQFRGPGGQGQSSEVGLPTQWSESKNVAWKVPVAGRGWSSPVVARGRVWLTTAVPVG